MSPLESEHFSWVSTILCHMSSARRGGEAGNFVWLCFPSNFLVIAQMVTWACLPHLDSQACQCLTLGLGWVPSWGRSLGLSGTEMKVSLFSFICFGKILHGLTYQSMEHAGTMLETWLTRGREGRMNISPLIQK